MDVENRTGRTVWMGLYNLSDTHYTFTTYPWGALQRLDPHSRGTFAARAERQQVLFWSDEWGDRLCMPKAVFTTRTVTLDEDAAGCYVYNHPGDPTPMDKIEHVVVLMLENRSFDNLLGWLYADQRNVPPRNIPAPSGGNPPSFVGLQERAYWNTDPADRHETAPEADRHYVQRGARPRQPKPNPSEVCPSFIEQMYGTAAPRGNQRPDMSGFFQNYKNHEHPDAPAAIMECYMPDQVPVLSSLARNYAVCDRWFGSVPCETWPNRAFLHAGTSFGRLNNGDQPDVDAIVPNFLPYAGKRTVFDVLDEMGVRWRLYQHAMVRGTLLSFQFWNLAQKLRRRTHDPLFELKTDLRLDGFLPQYIFIEPDYWSDPTDQHPPHPVGGGEYLIDRVHQVLVESGRWNRTLLIVTYDEHGGCYDHVPPPAAVPPDDSPRQFAVGGIDPFAVYGPRVPAVLVSPYIERGTVFRAPAEAWLYNDDHDGNYVPQQGGLYAFQVDINEVTCPAGRIVSGVMLRQKEVSQPPKGSSNDGYMPRLAPALLHTDPDGNDPQWLYSHEHDGWFPRGGVGLANIYADTHPVICPPGRVVTGFALRQKNNRLAWRLQHANPDGTDRRWLQNDDWDGGYIQVEPGLRDFYADTNPLFGPARAQFRGLAFRQKGNRLAPTALVQGAEYDHTSILASLRDWIGAPSDMLGRNERIRRAPTVWPVLTRTSPRTDKTAVTGPVTAPPAPTPQGLDAGSLTRLQIETMALGEAERVVVNDASMPNPAPADDWHVQMRAVAEARASELQAATRTGVLPGGLASALQAVVPIWIQNDQVDSNAFPLQAAPTGISLDTNPVFCPRDRIVTGAALWKKATDRLAPRLQHARPDGSDPQWLQNDELNSNHFPVALVTISADTSPLTCPAGRIVTGIALWPKTDRFLAWRLQHANLDGTDPQWLEINDANGSLPAIDLAAFLADTNAVTCTNGAQLRGVTFHQKGANRLAPRVLVGFPSPRYRLLR